MDLNYYRNKEIEKIRTDDLIKLIPSNCGKGALDIGARDGWFSCLLADRFEQVTALDLEKPSISHSKILCIEGDATNLTFNNEKFDLVFCAEVLEHIPYKNLAKVCSEIERVAKKYIIIGVPFKQDIRVGRTKCSMCGKRNPPWGHLNSFDEQRVKELFPLCDAKKITFVGENNECTNALSVFLMDFAENPYGTYNQEEPCAYCGSKLIKSPKKRNIVQKISTRMAFYFKDIQKHFHTSHPNWIHILFEKRKA